MAVAPTGAGKTVVFSYIADNASRLGNRVFIIVHRKELVRQTCKSLRFNDIPHGVIAAGYPITDTPIQVCSQQTLMSRLHLFQPPELLVWDEVHHIRSKSAEKIIEWAAQSTLLGVTATPIRADGKGFKNLFSAMVEADDIAKLIKDGWLVRPTYYAPPIPDLDLSQLHENSRGDYIEEEMEEVLDKPKITGSAVEHYKRHLPHYPPTVVFCASVKHAQNVAAEFCANGIPSASIDGSMDDEQRAALIKGLEDGDIKCLMSCDLVSEGFDLPAIVACIMLRPIGKKCLALYMQQLGRILRMFAGKTEAFCFDHVENWRRHGFAECDQYGQKRDWRVGFEGQKPKKGKDKGINLTRCPKCYAVFPTAAICPSCGHKLRAATGGGVGREIEETDGELVKLDTAAILTFRSTGANGGRKKQVITKLQRAK
jgi:superfamily II DNA or RNA helicase